MFQVQNLWQSNTMESSRTSSLMRHRLKLWVLVVVLMLVSFAFVQNEVSHYLKLKLSIAREVSLDSKSYMSPRNKSDGDNSSGGNEGAERNAKVMLVPPPPQQDKSIGSPERVQSELESMGVEPIFDSARIKDPWKRELFQRLDKIRVACGTLCLLNTPETIEEYTEQGSSDAPFPMVKVQPVNCPAILSLEELDAGDKTVPDIPSELKEYFLLGGTKVRFLRFKKRNNVYLGGKSDTSLWATGNVWKAQDVDHAIEQAANGTLNGSYGVNATAIFRDLVGELPLQGKSILVIGSSHPWVEAILLHHGAGRVTTLEYGEIISEHPKIVTFTPDQFRQAYLSGNLEMFDGVVSHSSVEHSGLGRYGDALNPWGDILTVARAWCVTKKKGFMYLGLPTGRDNILSNWHRTYGRIRWPLVATNWKVIPRPQFNESFLSQDHWAAQDNGGIGFLFQKHEQSSP